MRIVIKNADFSSVSIGKVVKDLSFDFQSSDGVAYSNAFFPNFNSGTPVSTEYYSGSEGGSVVAAGTTDNRIVSDYHEVIEGMIVEFNYTAGGSTIPNIIAFDANKNIVSSSCVWGSGFTIKSTLVVPAGVKYLKFQTSTTTAGVNNILDGYTYCKANMPE